MKIVGILGPFLSLDRDVALRQFMLQNDTNIEIYYLKIWVLE